MYSKVKKIVVGIFLLLSATASFAQEEERGIRFLEGEKWENVLQMAAEQDRLIFMDCYTSWCGPCKMLSKNVFSQPEAGDFFNARFVNVKYDMEKGEGIELRKRYQAYIIGYPTMLLIDKLGNVVHQMAGYHSAPELIGGMKAGSEGKTLFAYRERYAAGECDLAFLLEYADILNGAFLKEEIAQVAGAYLDTLSVERLQDSAVWALVGDYVRDPYSPAFEYVVFNLGKLVARLKLDRYMLEWYLERALEKELNAIMELQVDEKGHILPLRNEPGKMDTLMRLVNRAEMRRATECRAKKRIYDLELAGEWQEALRHVQLYREIRALGGTERFADQVIRYMAVNCKDKKLLRQALALMEEIQTNEDAEGGPLKAVYYGTMALLQDALGNSKDAQELREKDQEIREKNAKEFEQFMKQNKK